MPGSRRLLGSPSGRYGHGSSGSYTSEVIKRRTVAQSWAAGGVRVRGRLRVLLLLSNVKHGQQICWQKKLHSLWERLFLFYKLEASTYLFVIVQGRLGVAYGLAIEQPGNLGRRIRAPRFATYGNGMTGSEQVIGRDDFHSNWFHCEYN